MLLPRFSLRTLLIATAALGAFFLVLAAAVRGQVWAASITIAVGGVVLAFVLFAVFFAVALVISSVNPLRPRPVLARSPFAQHVPAPQIIPQEDEE